MRTGSKRVGKIGDIDARDGEALVLAAEVKQFTLTIHDVGPLTEFADHVKRQSALGLVVTLECEAAARDAMAALGLESVTRRDLLDRVRLWDTLKQRNAVQALLFYVTQIEKDREMVEAVRSFLANST